MEFDQVIQNRRSIRKFHQQAVETEKITAILDCARLCQSAKNRQPWRFMVLTEDRKNRVADIMLNLFEQNDVELPGYMNSSRNSANIIKNAPVLILVFIPKDEEWIQSDLLSVGAAIEHICLKAVDEGLGSVWIADTVYTREEICEELGRTDDLLVSGIAVGYADEQPSPRPRKTLEEIILKVY